MNFKEIVKNALLKAYETHNSLGISGEEMLEINQFGDTALKCDYECEEAVIDYLKEAGLSASIVSEEHGNMPLCENPRYLVILDGLDGSGVYKKSRGVGRYGTMLAIYDGVNPAYRDYLACGIIEHSTGRLFLAAKGEGAFLIENKNVSPIKASGCEKLDKSTRIYIDSYWEFNRKYFEEKLTDFKPECLFASCVYYADVASGNADLALECTRKKNLEIAVSFGLEKEAGAVMMDANGNELDLKKYFEFGQEDQLPVITASTKELALDLIGYLKNEN